MNALYIKLDSFSHRKAVLNNYFKWARSDEYLCPKPKFSASSLFKLVICFPLPFVVSAKCSLQKGWVTGNRYGNLIVFTKPGLPFQRTCAIQELKVCGYAKMLPGSSRLVPKLSILLNWGLLLSFVNSVSIVRFCNVININGSLRCVSLADVGSFFTWSLVFWDWKWVSITISSLSPGK